eukprot:3452020-Rhodomonas_salina.2
MQAHCPELNSIWQTAHNNIVGALVWELGELCDQSRTTVHVKPRVDSIMMMGPCNDPRMAMYEPDAIVEWTDKDYQKHLVVIKFTRSLREDAGTHDAK